MTLTVFMHMYICISFLVCNQSFHKSYEYCLSYTTKKEAIFFSSFFLLHILRLYAALRIMTDLHMPACLLPFILPFSRCLAALSLRPLGFTLLNSNLNYHLVIQLMFPFFVFSLLSLELPLCRSFPTPNLRAFQKL